MANRSLNVMNLLERSLILVILQIGLSVGYATDSSLNILPVISVSNTRPPPLTDLLSVLTTLHRKPTSYRTAATSVIHHCKSLSTDIPDRTLFAIKLTICELDLIQQTPSECRIESRWHDCLTILATRDNWWTTFSGNLREVTNVCWIGQQQIEKGIPGVHKRMGFLPA